MIGLGTMVAALGFILHCNIHFCEQEAIRIEQDDTITYTVDAGEYIITSHKSL